MGDLARTIPLARHATFEDLMAIPEEERRHEIIDGDLMQKAQPSFDHGAAILGVGSLLQVEYGRPFGRGGVGGWWLATDTDIALAPDQIYRPDIVGWLRLRVRARPSGMPVRIRPDWVCEILSPSNTTNDTVRKRRTYHRYEVSHYWILDPMAETLTVLRWTPDGYLIVADAIRGQRLRAEPFGAVELNLDEILGDPGEETPPPVEP